MTLRGLLIIATLATTLAVAAPANPGALFKDCDGCPEMVVIPPGSYEMGGSRRITLSRSFAVAKTEISFAQWDACVTEGGCRHRPDDSSWGRGNQPVMNVNWDDAKQYVAWLARKTGKSYRLLTEAEWEYAARAGTTTEYWFGDVMVAGEVNCRDCATEWSNVKTAPVGTFRPNPWGLYDVHGNLNEIVADCWNPSHKGVRSDGSARTDGDCKSRVFKGGAWYYNPKASRAAWRARNDARVASYVFGFRVLRELD